MQSISADASKDVYIGGQASSAVDFGGGALAPGGGDDVWFAKFAP